MSHIELSAVLGTQEALSACFNKTSSLGTLAEFAEGRWGLGRCDYSGSHTHRSEVRSAESGFNPDSQNLDFI